MKKIIVAISLALVASCMSPIYAQQIREMGTTINKVTQTATVGEFNDTKEALSIVLTQKFMEAGLIKSKSASNGFKVFNGVSWPEVSTETLDVYYKVTGKKNKATVEILISKGYENFISSQNDPAAIENVKHFISSLNLGLQNHNHNEKIKETENLILKAQKELDTRNKAVTKAQSGLEKAKKAVADQEKEMQTSKTQLLNLK